MKIAAFDIGKHRFGWADGSDLYLRDCGSFRLATDLGHAVDELARFLSQYETLDLIVIEKLNMPSRRSWEVMAGLRGVIEWRRYLTASRLIEVHPMTLKKWATGNGRADKRDMENMARARYPDIKIDSHDTADAVFLFHYARTNVAHTEGR